LIAGNYRNRASLFFSLSRPPIASMKRNAEPASLEEEEEDPRTGDIRRKAAASASITSSSDQFERRRKWRKSDLDFQTGSASKSLGSMLEIIGLAKEGEMLTVLAGEHEDNAKVWKDCEKSGRKYRVFYLVGECVSTSRLVSITDELFQTRS
jgi:hypothetical protein